MMKWFVCLVFVGLFGLLVGLPSVATASDVVNSDGYVYADGFYVKDGITYTRIDNWVWVPPCRTCYGYQSGYWKFLGYTYTPVQLPTPKDPEWKTKLLSIAAARDKAEGKLRLAAQEQSHFLEAVTALGLQGNFRYEAYGRNPVSPTAYGNLQLSAAGVNGNTIYGYSYSSVADAYGLDRNVLYQQANRQVLGAQQLAGQANSEFLALVQQEGANATRIAEILAKGQVGRQVIDGINSPGTRTETKINGTVVVPTEVQTDFLKLSGPATCVACHTGASPKAGFDVSKITTMSADEIVTKVLPRLVTANEKERMPKGLPALTAEQVRQFMGGR